MKRSINIVKGIFAILIAVLIATPLCLYIVLSTSWAQNDIRRVVNNELSRLLGTEVYIGDIEIHPFNRISIRDISALDDNRQIALKIDEISVAFELLYLLRTGNLVVDSAILDKPQLNLYKATPDSPINIAKLLDALHKDNAIQNRSNYDLKINTVVLLNGELNYDVLDQPHNDSVFNANHIAINEIFLNAYIPRISNEEYSIEIDRFSLTEASGFKLKKLKTVIDIKPNGSKVQNLSLQLPNSTIDFTPVELENKSLSSFVNDFKTIGCEIGIERGSNLYLPDLKAFAPMFGNTDINIDLNMDGRISSDLIDIKALNLSVADKDIIANLKAQVYGISRGVNALIDNADFRLYASAKSITDIAGQAIRHNQLSYLKKHIKDKDYLSININAKGYLNNAEISTDLSLGQSSTRLSVHYTTADTFRTINYKANGIANIETPFLSPLENKKSHVYATIAANGYVAGPKSVFSLKSDSIAVEYNGKRLNNIALTANIANQIATAKINIDDPSLIAVMDFQGSRDGKYNVISLGSDIVYARADMIGLTDKYSSYVLSGHIDTQAEFSTIDDIDGTLSLSKILFSDDEQNTSDFKLDAMTINAHSDGDSPGIEIDSDYINGYINGQYNISHFVPSAKRILAKVLPALEQNPMELYDISIDNSQSNNFTFSFKINECEEVCRFFDLPLSIINTIGINGHFSEPYGTVSINIDAPYLLNGDKIIESTMLTAMIDSADDRMNIYATGKFPTQKGPMLAIIDISGASNRLDSRIEWVIERKIPINGSFDFSTKLSRNDNSELNAQVNFNPGTITFGSDIWSINPSEINISPQLITVNNFRLASGNKSISIDGAVSEDKDLDELVIDLNKIALLDIFETLEIDKALIGGKATGTFTAHRLLSPQPEIYCPDLHVDSISYNRCVLGDAEIAARWVDQNKSFNLDAAITGFDGQHSHIYGDIFPASESLDINFDARHVPIGFMKPFMSAFASDLSGYASGHARLFGTFKYIDMTGDIFAEDLKIKIDFTNTWYSATDSIKLTPGFIDINNVTIYDINGNKALLNGFVKHKFFKEPSFKFDVTEAQDFLSYDVNSQLSPDWYGTIYGNGSAQISGEPGVVNIGVAMSTAPKSTFTFVLSDRLDADEYSFITFRDSRAEARRDSLLAADHIPDVVRKLRERIDAQNNNESSAYNMDLQIDINPNARMTIVMDPVGGDEINAIGVGNLRMTYQSSNNDLRMYGTYTLDRGNYNFTLQDIIIKDFTIRQGSTIAFHGDPYSAQLDIKAQYSVNANLSDLDESFLSDKDLNRTNVPVHAMLLVRGDMRQPDINFDLEFPTLTQDTYRKVRSIVSTEEMMNRQIIYLLALNRFYTPDYMASTTKGNELFSVASSTIASQLGNMLGKLSDNWSIAPNLRSDRGDFSDVEVDVALSSHLLNNRLLFNGNFGYRDNTLNTNQFIGDFDIEYLINPKGNWRLKAYNRYNDQNYYVRTAQTTQGIGFVFKRDFDDFFGFLKHKKRNKAKSNTSDSTGLDSTTIAP